MCLQLIASPAGKAGVWLFGKDWGTDNSRDLIMYNALDLEEFQFDAQTRCEYRVSGN